MQSKRDPESRGNENHGIPASEGVDKHKEAVTPAKAGVLKPLKTLDSRFHGNDRKRV